MRVDQQHRLAGGGVRARDRDAIRSGRLCGPRRPRIDWSIERACLAEARCRIRVRRRILTVERFQLSQVHALDVAANAAFAETQRHPRLELRDHARLHVRMRGEIEVEAVRPSIHQGLQPRLGLRVLRLHVRGIDEQLHPQVAPDLGFPFRFGEPALRVDEIGLDAVEVVFRLRVHQAEHHVGVGLGVDVRHAPVVADDRDALSARLPRRQLRTVGRGRRRGLGRTRRQRDGKNDDEFLHGDVILLR